MNWPQPNERIKQENERRETISGGVQAIRFEKKNTHFKTCDTQIGNNCIYSVLISAACLNALSIFNCVSNKSTIL